MVGRWTASLVRGFETTDGVTVTVVIGIMLLVGLANAWAPARRAVRVYPAVALREE